MTSLWFKRITYFLSEMYEVIHDFMLSIILSVALLSI